VLTSRSNGDCYRGVQNQGAAISVALGSTIQVRLNGYINWTYVNCFADWNSDGDFSDDGETIGKLPARESSFNTDDTGRDSYRNFSITIPNNASIGETRLRLFMAWGITDACTLSSTTNAAIAADFLLNITATTLANPRTVSVESANASQGTAVISNTTSTSITTTDGVVSVTANPNSGYKFLNWKNKSTSAIVSTSNPYLYTGSSDKEGSLGGLVELGDCRKLIPMIKSALENALVCTNDPECLSKLPTSQKSSGAACHSCCMISETACENGNRMLDRALVVPLDEREQFAYFKDLVDELCGLEV
jgi:hypothetical protein